MGPSRQLILFCDLIPSKLDLVNISGTRHHSMYLEHFDFQVHPITVENLAYSTAVDMTVHKSKKVNFLPLEVSLYLS